MEIKDIDRYSAVYNQPFFIASGFEHFELPNVSHKSFREYFLEAGKMQSETDKNLNASHNVETARNDFNNSSRIDIYTDKTSGEHNSVPKNRITDDEHCRENMCVPEKDSNTVSKNSMQDSKTESLHETVGNSTGAEKESVKESETKTTVENAPEESVPLIDKSENQQTIDGSSNDTPENQAVQETENELFNMHVTDVGSDVSIEAISAQALAVAGQENIVSQTADQLQAAIPETLDLLKKEEAETEPKNPDLTHLAGKDKTKPELLTDVPQEHNGVYKESMINSNKLNQTVDIVTESSGAKTQIAESANTSKDAKPDHSNLTVSQGYTDVSQNNATMSNNGENFQNNTNFQGQKVIDSIIPQSENDETSFKTLFENVKNDLSMSLESTRTTSGAEKNISQSVEKEINLPRYSDVRLDEKELLQDIQSKIQLRNYDGLRHSEIRFRLNPDSLGALSLKLVMENDTLSARIKVENNTVREIIENNLTELRKSLQAQGVKVEKVEVSLKNDTEQPSYSPEGQTGNGHIKQRNKQFLNRLSTRNSVAEKSVSKNGAASPLRRFHEGQLDYLI
ncbi:flagellar hook-length control protein FliK [bacterium]|nr:flagellar hook-length control protein FliK [bacterium]